MTTNELIAAISQLLPRHTAVTYRDLILLAQFLEDAADDLRDRVAADLLAQQKN